MIELGGAMRGPESGVAAALEVAKKITREPWRQKLIVQRAIRSHSVDGQLGPRLPIYVVHDDGDPILIRDGFSKLFKANGVHGQPWGQASFIHMASEPCVIQDMTASSPGSFYWVRQLAYHRSLPNSVVGEKKGGTRGCYGDTVIIIPFELGAEAAAWGYVIEADGDSRGSMGNSDYTHSLRNWRAHAEWLLSKTYQELRVDPHALPESGPTSGYLRHGHLYDMAFAARLENACGIDGFVEAGRQSWAYISRQVGRRLTTRQQDAIVLSYIKQFLQAGQADLDGGFREDKVAAFIRDQDPDVYAQYGAIDLGKALSRWGIGSVSRHGFYDEARRVIRAVVNFTDDDRARIEQLTHGI